MNTAVLALFLAGATADDEAMFKDEATARQGLEVIAPRMNALDPTSCRDVAGLVGKAAEAVATAESTLAEKKNAIAAILKKDKDKPNEESDLDGTLAKAVKAKDAAVKKVLDLDKNAEVVGHLKAYNTAQKEYREKVTAHY